MSISMSALSRGRASLLAGSMFATTALAGLGGIVGAIALTPGAALAQTCTPDTNGTSLIPNVLPSPATGSTETCVGGNATGIGYSEDTPFANLTVNLNGPAGAVVNGVLLEDNLRTGHAANLTLVLGNATTIGQNIITAGNQSLTAVTITSTAASLPSHKPACTPSEGAYATCIKSLSSALLASTPWVAIIAGAPITDSTLAFSPRYNTATIPIEISTALGIVLPGLRVSPPRNVTL